MCIFAITVGNPVSDAMINYLCNNNFCTLFMHKQVAVDLLQITVAILCSCQNMQCSFLPILT